MPPVTPEILRPAFAVWVMLLGLLPSLAAAPSPPWPHEVGDVASDPAIRWGRLDNGLRYAIRPNALPAGRVYLVLQVDVGSLHERDDQRGYAHFVEHMMFRGTKKYPANTLIGFLQHEGLGMGADTSAFTNYRSTFYNLDLPKNSPEKISLGLSILRDFADGALFGRNDVKPEAKVVESERRTRESSLTKIGDALGAFHHPDSRYTFRSPIGLPAIVQQATAKQLQEFYRTWYRPERMTVIAVGDADPALLERLIRENFATLAGTTPAPVVPDLEADTPPADGTQAAYFASPVPAGTTTLLSCIGIQPETGDLTARRRRYLVLNAACSLMNARFAEFARKNPDEIGQASASWILEAGHRRRATVSVDTRGSQWRRGLRLAEQELRRALQHGFNPDEVQLFVQGQRNSYQQAIRTAANRTSESIAQQLRSNLEYGWITTDPAIEWAIAEPVLASLTPEDCNASFRELWSPANRRVAIIGYHPSPLTKQEILTAYEESTGSSFQLGADEHVLAEFDYTDFGPAGTVASRTRHEPIDAESVTFANGVALNLKRTDFEKDLVYLRLRLGRGLMAEPADQPGLGTLATGSYISGGVGHYDNVELGRRLAGTDLSIRFQVEEDACTFTGRASPQHLPRLLQLVTAFITDAAYRPEGFQEAVSQLQSHYPDVNREPTKFLRSYCPALILGGDSRYGLPLVNQIFQREPAQIKDWLKHQLTHARIEIGLAGDLDPEAAIDAVARTLGTLPARDQASLPGAERPPVMAKHSLRHQWQIADAEATKAAVHVYWPGVDDDDIHTSRRLQVLAQILNDRLRVKIREELGATYGPQHDVWGSNTWPGLGYLMVEIETSPKLVERVADLTLQTAADLAAKGITPEEFSRAVEPILASLPQQLRDNQYWTFHVLSQLQQNPRRAEWPLTRAADYSSMKRTDVEAAARRFLGGTAVHAFIARPKP